ncbi:pseudaminic acid cytidylyltransferase [Riemerella anatipestifer]|uniref:pseudaminic acid cytidylyltransferase n=1 Tax=Riemerella anatipestifer TaxID=34085 RepID=UPI002A8CD465|nr:pseudaminic acid cytidylyltransferase [Riemerella anatipestifer]
MKNLCVIPARGGSKRIPKKNIKKFLGKPIISYSIDVAKNSGLFDEVIVSTDDDEIKNIAQSFGAKVPFMRSETSANDFATLSDVLEEVKEYYEKIDVIFDNICMILPTAPFVTVDLLQQSFNLLKGSEVDSVRPIVRFSYPIQRSLKRNADGLVEMISPKYRNTRSQDLEPAFHDSGMFYFMKWDKGLAGENKYGIEISEIECHDIDTADDWAMAEFKFKYLNQL